MNDAQNPWEIGEWRALNRESSLVRSLIGSGVTALGKASYGDKKGEYYTAFFALSVGLERLAKLILITDFALQHNGQLPNQKILTKYGHKLHKLLDEANEIQERHGVKLTFSRPTSEIPQRIIECLDLFADASRGRYANIGALGNPNFSEEFEPIRKWWDNVATLILERHYFGKSIRNRVERNAHIVDRMLGGHASVLFLPESGETIHDVLSASIRSGQTELVQKFGRYYTLMLVRWLSDLFCKLTLIACHKKQLDAFFGHDEFFSTFRVDDDFLLRRRVWPLR
jgi:hypothetical protein